MIDARILNYCLSHQLEHLSCLIYNLFLRFFSHLHIPFVKECLLWYMSIYVFLFLSKQRYPSGCTCMLYFYICGYGYFWYTCITFSQDVFFSFQFFFSLLWYRIFKDFFTLQLKIEAFMKTLCWNSSCNNLDVNAKISLLIYELFNLFDLRIIDADKFSPLVGS